MIKKLVSLFIIAVILVTTFCACGEDDDIALVMPITSDPMCLDPQIAETDEAKLIVSNCYEGLVRLDEKGEIIPGVAESWTVSPDGLTYTFKLRQDTNWQLLKSFKGVFEDENYLENFKTKVTAYDFQFALRRAVDKITDSPDAEKLYCIKNARQIHSGEADKSSLGVNASDESTLVITLERANSDFLRILTLPLCMPCNEEFFNATHAKYGLELKYTFCNGPFYLARWAVDNSLVMYRNEGYVGAQKVSPTAVYFNVNKEEESVVSKLKQLTYHCAFVSDEAAQGLRDNNKVSCVTTENEVVGLAFNCSDRIMQNESLRKALVMMTSAKDIEKPANAIAVAKGIVPDCCRFANKAYRQAAGVSASLGYNEKKAVELWQEGLKTLESESAGVKIICTEEYSAQMQEVIQTWQKILSTAIVAKVEVMSADELKKAVKDDNYQIAVTGIKAETANVTDTLEFFTSGNSKNIFNYSDTEYDKIYDDILTTYQGDEILAGIRSAEKTLADKAVFCPLFTYGDFVAIGEEATGLVPSSAFESICFINGGLD
ncbi:MAG: peptide ABC transporter substrate-binding protein [Clostridia bacterium]|nr:peptide ABC transporter substrate-binding protein [Clostridia bacterium]